MVNVAFRNKNLEAAKDALRLDLMKLRRSAIQAGERVRLSNDESTKILRLKVLTRKIFGYVGRRNRLGFRTL